MGDGSFDLLTTNYITDCSVVDSYFRCFIIHATDGTTWERNTAFNITGHCLYIEDGVEELNNFYYNAIAHVHPIGDHELGLLNIFSAILYVSFFFFVVAHFAFWIFKFLN